MGRLSRGFTIVELLIVIVVIAILAAIAIVAYNGIQDRARNSKTLSLVDQWEKSIRMYQVTSNYLPEDWTCLGNSVNDFPADTSKQIGLGQCERNIIVTNPTPDWTSELKTVPTTGQTRTTVELLSDNASLSPGGIEMLEVGSNGYIRGIVYASIFEPERAPSAKPGAFIFFALKGQECPSGTAYRTLESLRVCAKRLTTDNYINEIFRPS